MNTTPRRGRPPRSERPQTPLTELMPASAPAVQALDDLDDLEDAKPTRRRRRSSTGGFFKKLETPPPPEGWMYRWWNDTPGRLAKAEELAYDHVTDPTIRSDNPGGPVRRLVGIQSGGQPLHAYLMMTPIEEWERGQAEREDTHRLVEQAITEGRDATGRVQDAYGEGSIRAR